MGEERLADRHCEPCHGGVPPLDEAESRALVADTPLWQICSSGKAIEREFSFKDFHHTIAFVNAVAWIAHREDHHPDLEVGYNRCRIQYATHAIDGLSENDFICAARIDALVL